MQDIIKPIEKCFGCNKLYASITTPECLKCLYKEQTREIPTKEKIKILESDNKPSMSGKGLLLLVPLIMDFTTKLLESGMSMSGKHNQKIISRKGR